MRILDKYLLKNIAISYLSILIMFIGLHILIDIFSTLSDILENQPSIGILIEYYALYLPLIILRVSPAAFLMSALYNYSSLGKNNELISMRVSGISALRTAYPAIFLSIFISCFVFFLQEKTLLESQSRRETIKSQYIEKETLESEITNLSFKADNSIFFIETFFPQEKKLENVIIFVQDSQGQLLEKIHTPLIKYQKDKWLGYNVIKHTLKETGRLERAPVLAAQKQINLSKKPSELAFERSKFIEFAPLSRLRKQIANLGQFSQGVIMANLKAEFHNKITIPFSHIFLIIGSLPIALEIKKKKAAFAAVAIGFLFYFIYYLMDSVSLAFGKTEVLLPVLSAWLAPLFFLSVGITGLFLMR